MAVADFIVRLRMAPQRQDKFQEEILECMSEPEPVEHRSQVNRTPTMLYTDQCMGLMTSVLLKGLYSLAFLS